MKKNEERELIFHNVLLKIPYKWAAGDYTGEFLTELKETGKIYSNRCPNCGRYSCRRGPSAAFAILKWNREKSGNQ